MTPRLLLASSSPSRRALLAAAHIRHVAEASRVDEEATLAAAGPGLAPAEQVAVLARAKALDVAGRLAPGTADPAFVLGCDSLFELDGVAYGKPHTAARARERLAAMSGRAGVLHTGHCLVRTADGAVFDAVRSSVVVVADLSEDDIDAYVATGEPLAVAGSFTLEGYGGAFIEAIEGDHHNVLGLSLVTLRALLARAGTAITQLWETEGR